MQIVYKSMLTYTILLDVKDANGVPIDPTVGVPTFTMYDNAGELVLNAKSMNKYQGKVGVYSYTIDLSTLSAGIYPIVMSFTEGDTYTFSDALQVADFDFIGTGGSTKGTITLTDSETGDPIEGAVVWLNTTSTGSGISTVSKTTNSFGRATFYVEPGTYYLFSDIQPTYISQEVIS